MLDIEEIRHLLKSFYERCSFIRAAGGVSLESVVDHKATVPDGWIFDPDTNYYIPPNLLLDDQNDHTTH